MEELCLSDSDVDSYLALKEAASPTLTWNRYLTKDDILTRNEKANSDSICGAADWLLFLLAFCLVWHR